MIFVYALHLRKKTGGSFNLYGSEGPSAKQTAQLLAKCSYTSHEGLDLVEEGCPLHLVSVVEDMANIWHHLHQPKLHLRDPARRHNDFSSPQRMWVVMKKAQAKYQDYEFDLNEMKPGDKREPEDEEWRARLVAASVMCANLFRMKLGPHTHDWHTVWADRLLDRHLYDPRHPLWIEDALLWQPSPQGSFNPYGSEGPSQRQVYTFLVTTRIGHSNRGFEDEDYECPLHLQCLLDELASLWRKLKQRGPLMPKDFFHAALGDISSRFDADQEYGLVEIANGLEAFGAEEVVWQEFARTAAIMVTNLFRMRYGPYTLPWEDLVLDGEGFLKPFATLIEVTHPAWIADGDLWKTPQRGAFNPYGSDDQACFAN